MRRRSSSSIVANPVLVGAVTTLVVVVAVFLAYNAGNGLPFVPTREINVQVANGANLVKGNEVREGGFRIGVVEELKPVTLPNGQTLALLKLKLDKKVGDIPRDSTVRVRPRSALGLKFIEFNKGKSRHLLKDGDTIPVAQTVIPVQFDEVYRLFDTPTRRASQDNLREFGNAFAGRGGDLNETISKLPPLFGNLRRVAANLADPRTGLARFFSELGDAARIVAPIAGVNARLFTDMATTFEAFSRDPRALQDTIAKSPSTLDVSTRSLRVQRPFLNDTAAFSGDLNLATAELRRALPDINPALEEGTKVLPRTVPVNSDLKDVFRSLDDLARAPGTNIALRALQGTVATLNPQLRFLGPYQTVCDGWNYFWTYVAEHFSETDPTGSSERALLNSAGDQTNSIGAAGAYEPANGEGYNPATAARGDAQFLHGQPYGAAVNNDGTADCEQGQRGYPMGNLSVLGRPKDLQGNPYRVTVDPHTPGSQGPTFAGRPRVPAGETFTREPTTGERLDPALTGGIYSGGKK